MRYISRISNDNREQLNIDHLRECADYAYRLGEKVCVPNIAYLTSLFHDMGKFSESFLNYLNASHEAGENRKISKNSVVHSIQGAKYLYELQNTGRNIEEAIVKEIISMCIANHHGGLMDGITADGDTPFRDRMQNESDHYHYTEVIRTFSESGVLTEAPQIIMGRCVEEMKEFLDKCRKYRLNYSFMIHFLTKYIYSCLVDADRYNAYCFEAEIPMDYSFMPLWDDYILRLEDKVRSFPVNTDINRLRHEVSEMCFNAAARAAGVYLLNVPTGGGKTLSSLRFALNHAKNRNLDHIIYVIPYLSVLEQTVNDIKIALKYDDKKEDFLLEHHSNWSISDDEKEAQAHSLLTDRWDSPIIVTTMVQFLESIYSEKSGRLRKLHNMSNAVVIFDEVQSLPVKCTHLFNEAVNFLHNMANCTILLCTATQPPFHEAYRRLYLSDSPSLIFDMTSCFLDLGRTRVIDDTIRGGYSMEALSQFVLERYLEEGNCLIILNTKKDAKALLSAVERLVKKEGDGSERIVYLSTDMCAQHRLDVISAMKNNGLERTICISTQLIEAGVDISFRCVIRAMAGLDSIAQAAGRCNRNGEEEKAKKVHLVNIADEDLSFLPDIKCGADITWRILAEKRDDLLAPDVLERYYIEYYSKQASKMDYSLKSGSSIYDFLAENQKGTDAFRNKGGKDIPALRQAFQSAGKQFSLIDQQTISIFVPYAEGEGLLKKYRKAGIKEKNRLLRQLGKYSVSIYQWQLKKLAEQGALTMENDQIWILNTQFYSEKSGVIYESEGM